MAEIDRKGHGKEEEILGFSHGLDKATLGVSFSCVTFYGMLVNVPQDASTFFQGQE